MNFQPSFQFFLNLVTRTLYLIAGHTYFFIYLALPQPLATYTEYSSKSFELHIGATSQPFPPNNRSNDGAAKQSLPTSPSAKKIKLVIAKSNVNLEEKTWKVQEQRSKATLAKEKIRKNMLEESSSSDESSSETGEFGWEILSQAVRFIILILYIFYR